MEPTPMTKAFRRQVYTIDLVHAVSVNLACNKGTVPVKTSRAAERIHNRVKNIQRILKGPGLFVLKSKDLEKYKNNLDVLKEIILAITTDNRLGNEFLSAILFLVAVALEESRRGKNRILCKEWEMLSKSLFTLYGHSMEPDPEPEPGPPGPGSRDNTWAGYQDIFDGHALGARLETVFI